MSQRGAGRPAGVCACLDLLYSYGSKAADTSLVLALVPWCSQVAVLVDDMIDTAGTITNAAKVRAHESGREKDGLLGPCVLAAV